MRVRIAAVIVTGRTGAWGTLEKVEPGWEPLNPHLPDVRRGRRQPDREVLPRLRARAAATRPQPLARQGCGGRLGRATQQPARPARRAAVALRVRRRSPRRTGVNGRELKARSLQLRTQRSEDVVGSARSYRLDLEHAVVPVEPSQEHPSPGLRTDHRLAFYWVLAPECQADEDRYSELARSIFRVSIELIDLISWAQEGLESPATIMSEICEGWNRQQRAPGPG